MMTKEALEKLRSKLPRGYGKVLKETTGKSESAIYKALVGKIESPDIIKAAIELAKEHTSDNKDMLNDIESL